MLSLQHSLLVAALRIIYAFFSVFSAVVFITYPEIFSKTSDIYIYINSIHIDNQPKVHFQQMYLLLEMKRSCEVDPQRALLHCLRKQN